MTNTEQDATSPKTTTPAKKHRNKVYCKSYRRNLNSCTSWAQAYKKGFCVRCFDTGWPPVLDQIDAQTKPSVSAFLLNNKTTSQEDTYTEVFNQRVTTSSAKQLLALQNHDPPSAGWCANLDQIHTQTKPSASAFLLNKKSTPQEDTCTEILNQGIATLPAEGLLALQNYDPSPSETDFNQLILSM
jgi:hypothetical protein